MDEVRFLCMCFLPVILIIFFVCSSLRQDVDEPDSCVCFFSNPYLFRFRSYVDLKKIHIFSQKVVVLSGQLQLSRRVGRVNSFSKSLFPVQCLWLTLLSLGVPQMSRDLELPLKEVH